MALSNCEKVLPILTAVKAQIGFHSELNYIRKPSGIYTFSLNFDVKKLPVGYHC